MGREYYVSLVYAYLKEGNIVVFLSLSDEMYKKRLMVSLKIYKSFCASFANDNICLYTLLG